MYSIADYGAKPDGKTLCTAAVQSAIDACARAGGGRVTVPAGIWLTGTVWLKSNVELHLSHGATLLASTDLADYNGEDAYPQNFGCLNEGWVGKHLIIAHEADNVALTGTGTVDGNGGAFFAEPTYGAPYIWRDGVSFNKGPDAFRPGQMICFIECENVLIRDIRLQYTPCWGLFLFGCVNVSIRGLRAYSPAWFKNSDGLDIDCCRNVTVSDCMIDTGDDAIAIRGCTEQLKRHPGQSCENIVITNCVLASASSVFRVGLGKGIIRHIRVNNIAINRGGVGIQLQTDYCGSGAVTIEDICFSDVTATHLSHPLVMQENSNVPLRHIRIEGYRAEVMACAALLARHRGAVSDITLKDITLVLCDEAVALTPEIRKKRGNFLFECENVENLRFRNIRLEASEDARVRWDGMWRLDGCEVVSPE